MADDFKLNLEHMDEAIANVQALAQSTVDLQQSFQTFLTKATNGWYGKSRTEFDKKAHMLFRGVTDISETLYEIAEDLLAAGESYMQADTDLAKTQDGVSNRF